MSIEWSKPLFDGGESVTGYSIEIRDASRIDWVSSASIGKLSLTLVAVKSEGSNALKIIATHCS